MSPDPLTQTAGIILGAHASGRLLAADDVPIEASEAFAIQRLVVGSWLERGERIVGWKLGYTSEAMRRQMGVADPNFGPLTDRMLLESGEPIPSSAVQPRVEPEIALVMATDVDGRQDAESIRGHVRGAHAALEIVDSVWRDYRFTWAQNTADGSSAAFVVLGAPLAAADLAAVEVALERNGTVVATGRGAAAMGDPFAALAWLSGQLQQGGTGLRAGDVVITGGLTIAVPIAPGDTVRAAFGSVTVETVRSLGDRTGPDGRVDE